MALGLGVPSLGVSRLGNGREMVMLMGLPTVLVRDAPNGVTGSRAGRSPLRTRMSNDGAPVSMAVFMYDDGGNLVKVSCEGDLRVRAFFLMAGDGASSLSSPAAASRGFFEVSRWP